MRAEGLDSPEKWIMLRPIEWFRMPGISGRRLCMIAAQLVALGFELPSGWPAPKSDSQQRAEVQARSQAQAQQRETAAQRRAAEASLKAARITARIEARAAKANPPRVALDIKALARANPFSTLKCDE